MACPMLSISGLFRDIINFIIIRIAWLVADLLGWRAALTVYPAVMRGKVAIVTGANAGLGLETTKALLQQGATVIMACRSMEAAHTAREDILRDRDNHGPLGDAAQRLIPLHLDLQDFPSIKQFVSDFHSLNLPLHLLVNNAGVHLQPYERVSLDFEKTMATNYFGPFWLTQLLLDDLKGNAPSRIVNVASIIEQIGLFGFYTRHLPVDDIPGYQLHDSGERPYVIAKTFLLMAGTREMAKRLEGTGVDVIAVHPGVVDTPLHAKSDPDAYLFSRLINRAWSLLGREHVRVGQKAETGAISIIYASIEPSLTGSTSSSRPTGILDSITRTLFGGRLRFYGPGYLPFTLNWNNAGRQFPWNPWVYNKQACSRLYDATVRLIQQVEQKLSSEAGSEQQQQQQQGLERDRITAGGAAKAAETRSGVADAPMGQESVMLRE